jgi:hypothetical protein
MKKELKRVEDGTLCPEGGTHIWIWRGKEAGIYVCNKCGGKISKVDLKDETDPTYLATVAAATAVVGYDLFNGLVFSRAPNDRIITGFGLKGSTAALDTLVDLYVDETRIAGGLANTGTGVPNNDDILEMEDLFVPGGAQIRCIVVDAPTTNPINALISLEDY